MIVFKFAFSGEPAGWIILEEVFPNKISDFPVRICEGICVVRVVAIVQRNIREFKWCWIFLTRVFKLKIRRSSGRQRQSFKTLLGKNFHIIKSDWKLCIGRPRNSNLPVLYLMPRTFHWWWASKRFQIDTCLLSLSANEVTTDRLRANLSVASKYQFEILS